jgi:hypothetical protein
MEIFCEILAKKEGRVLPDKFWTVEPWKKLFRSQIPAAVSLLKKYPLEVVVNTLRDYRISSKINSLRAQWLLKPVLEEKLIEYKGKNKEVKEEMVKTSTIEQPRGGLSTGRSLIEQLKEIENQ